MRSSIVLVVALYTTVANTHLAVFTKGMWCLNGVDGNNFNSDDPVSPLFELEQDQWWFHAVNGCNKVPPADGDILELPAGQSITVEIAGNQGVTSLSFDGQYVSDWPDGLQHPDDYNVPTCITAPNMHTQNQSMAAGSALAISYVSDINDVTPENLVVFSVAYNTPWKRLTTYDVPAAMPPCPDGGCICAWGWIPNGCGQGNMYHQAIRCNVTGSTSTTPVGSPQPPVWCEGDQSQCVSGPKQMLYWHQASGSNIEVSGFDQAGGEKVPGYNSKCGFPDGAQNDIFTGSGSVSSSSSSSSSWSSSSSSSSSSSASASSSSGANYVDVANTGSGSSSSSDASSSTWSSSSDTSSSSNAWSSSSDNSSPTDTWSSSSTWSSSTDTSSPTDTWSSSSAPTDTWSSSSAPTDTWSSSSAPTDAWSSSSSSWSSDSPSSTDPSASTSLSATSTSTSTSSSGRKCKRRVTERGEPAVKHHRAAIAHHRRNHKRHDVY